ncbi:DUF167 domain-containing protein [Candidatus Saccharibacteria bacterium]|nr:DUF167 domain-containing protein [Candidatus Saccharibacteria bacterium]
MKVNVRVKPGSKKGPLVESAENRKLVVYVREAAVDGKANEAVIKILADHFDVAKTRIKIIRGFSSKTKTIEIN